MKATEKRPELGGINAEFDNLHEAGGALRDAILALPFGNGSSFYEEPGYFNNVRSGSSSFSFVLEHLSPRPGVLHLDLGADLTWSTAHLAGKGLRSIAIDINDHLKVARLFRERFDVDYACMRADMHQECFAPESFGVITAFSALHHSGRLSELCRNLYRMTVAGGEVGFVEPFCRTEEERARFGAAQKEVGINEHVYTLSTWHQAFVAAGFELYVARVDCAFHAIYRKPLRQPTPDSSADGYRNDVRLMAENLSAAPGQSIEVKVLVRNIGTHVWRSEGAHPVFISYHLRHPPRSGNDLVRFDNERTPIPDVAPAQLAAVTLHLTAPTTSGSYVVEVDLVHEGITWFAGRGGVSPRMRLDVR